MGINSIKKKIGFFPGTFDLVHAGHILALEEAKKHCDYLVVGLQTDPSKDRKGKNKPIMSVEERRLILRGNKNVDAILLYENEKELAELDKWFGDVRFMGEDHPKKHRDIKAEIIYLQRKHNYSSSNLRQKIYEHTLQSQKNWKRRPDIFNV